MNNLSANTTENESTFQYAHEIKDIASIAFDGVSFSSEERSNQVMVEYEEHLIDAKNVIASIAQTDAQKAAVDIIFEAYHEGCKKRYLAWLSAKSRIYSTMIAGPSNFPARQMEKRSRTEHKRMTELIEYQKKCTSVARRKFNALLTPEETIKKDDDAELKRLRKKLINCASVILNPDGSDVALFRSNLAGMIKRSSSPTAVKAILKEIIKLQDKTGLLIFKPNNSIWKFGEDLPEEKDIEIEKVEAEKEGIQIISNRAIDRLQIVFPGKPNEEMRRRLKSRGFRWSPRNTAWQRQLTSNAIAAAFNIIGVVHYNK